MATEITTIYDALVTRLGSLLTSHKRLTNPYNPSDNNTLFLNKGWGLAIGSGTNTERYRTCKLSMSRLFDIVITRKYYSKDHDAATRASTEKLLLEDLQLIYDDFEENANLNTDFVLKPLADDGIEEVFAEERPFLSIRLGVSVEYFRNL